MHSIILTMSNMIIHTIAMLKYLVILKVNYLLCITIRLKNKLNVGPINSIIESTLLWIINL